jgi:hypothetical protein
MKSSIEGQLVLKKRIYVEFKGELSILFLIALITLLLFPLLLLLVLGESLSIEGLLKVMNHLTEYIAKSFAEDPFDASMHTLMFLGFIGFYIYLYLGNKYERLIVSPLGIQYLSPLRGVFSMFYPDWFLRWEQVIDAHIQAPRAGMNSSFFSLVLVTSSATRKLHPGNWIDPESWQPPKRKFFSMPTGKRPEQSFDTIMKTDLITAVREYLPAKNIELNEGSKLFDLGSHSATMVFTISLFVLLAYAIVDTFFVFSDVYIDSPPLNLFVSGGLVFAVVAFLVMHRAKIPMYIIISLALMNGVAFAAAMHPGLLRINQLTDNDGLREFTYIREANNIYSPEQPGTPAISMQQPYEYWAQFQPGSRYVFLLRRGQLGFWQLNESSLIESYREFFTQDRNQ